MSIAMHMRVALVGLLLANMADRVWGGVEVRVMPPCGSQDVPIWRSPMLQITFPSAVANPDKLIASIRLAPTTPLLESPERGRWEALAGGKRLSLFAEAQFPSAALTPATTYTLRLPGSSASGIDDAHWAPLECPFTTSSHVVDAVGAQSAAQRALRRVGATTANANVVRVTSLAGTSYWTAVSRVGGCVTRAYVLADGTVLLRRFAALAPTGDLRILTVIVDRGRTSLSRQVDSEWAVAQGIVSSHVEESLNRGRPQAEQLHLVHRNVVIPWMSTSDEISRPALEAALGNQGIRADAQTIVVALDLEPMHTHGGMAYPEDSFITMGWFFEAREEGSLDSSELLGLARACYVHELAHLFGWEHSWAGDMHEQFTVAPAEMFAVSDGPDDRAASCGQLEVVIPWDKGKRAHRIR